MSSKKPNDSRIFFEIEERANGKWKVVKYQGIIYGFYRSYRKLKADFPKLREMVRKFPPINPKKEVEEISEITEKSLDLAIALKDKVK